MNSSNRSHVCVWFLVFLVSSCGISVGSIESERVLDWQSEHVHASSLAELPNGDLLVCWFQGSGERRANDVRVMGARRRAGDKEWSEPFVLADTPDHPDCNPVLYVDRQDRLWLFWIVVRANRWEYSILKYRRSEDYAGEGAPRWTWQDVIVLKPGDAFAQAVSDGFEALGVDESMWAEYALPYERLIRDAAMEPRKRQEGWMTRNHPIGLASGRMVLPLYSDGFNLGLAAVSDDAGETWGASLPMVGVAGIQPSIVEADDGRLVAYFRETGRAPFRVQRSVSLDQGLTWSPMEETAIPNPSASLQVIRLRQDGLWAMIFNDSDRDRTKLTVALSDDEGTTWPWRRRITEDADASYPSLIQAADGSLHASYSIRSEGGKSIGHSRVDVDWLRQSPRLDRLALPERNGSVEIVLDADMYNEVDDQFAFAYAMQSKDRIRLRAVCAAPFLNHRSRSPGDGMEKSYQETLRLLELMDRSEEGLAFRGADSFLSDAATPVDSPAARRIIALAKEPREGSLYVVGLGAATNIASALLLDPSIAEDIVILWIGGHPHDWPHARDFNLKQDVAAAQVVFNSGAPLLHIPAGDVAEGLAITLPKLETGIKGVSPMADFLLKNVEGYYLETTRERGRPERSAWSKVIWDIATIAWLRDGGRAWVTSEIVPTPRLSSDGTWIPDPHRPLMRVATGLERDAVFEDVFDALRTGRR